MKRMESCILDFVLLDSIIYIYIAQWNQIQRDEIICFSRA